MRESGLADLGWRDILTTALVAAVLALALRTFVLGAFVIPSHSMEETVLEGDYLLVSRVAYLFADVHRGDVVVFSLPDSLRGAAPDELFIKRVIGLPGDTVRLSTTGVYVNHRRFPDPPEAKQPAGPLLGIGATDVTVVVPDRSYFVLGDNRSNSYDSRYWGCLPDDRIEGAPLLVYWSYGPTPADITRHVRWDRLLRRVL